MAKISLIAKLTAAEGKVDDVKAALATLIEAADEEAGLLIYGASQAKDDPRSFVFFELYENEEALGVHGKGEGMAAAMKALGGLLDGRPEVTLMDPVVAKGIDFS